MHWINNWHRVWNQFWFDPQTATTLAIIRWLTGCMVFYNHLVWSLGMRTFLSSQAALPNDYRGELLPSGQFAWSHFDGSDSDLWLWGSHIAGLIVIAMWTVGFKTRWTGWLTAALVISYANRATGALFGFDQIATFLCLYLAISRCGDALSVDAKLAVPAVGESGQGRAVANRIATRLIQIHLCIVYAFAGLGKLGGEYWLNGEAVWGALASYEYQSIDMTWLAGHMTLIAAMTLVSLFWEVTYAALIWPKLTRPIVLTIAVFVHIGIGAAMGMMTFGLIMLVANLAFIEPQWWPIGRAGKQPETPIPSSGEVQTSAQT